MTTATELAESLLVRDSQKVLNTQLIKNMFYQMLAFRELEPLIKIAHHYVKNNQLTIILDPSTDTVFNLTMGQSNEILQYRRNDNEATLYLAAKHSKNIKKNRSINQCCMVYGITLFVVDIVLNNTHPDLLKSLERLQISELFASKWLDNERSNLPEKLLANMAQLIWAEKSSYRAGSYSQELMEFYQDQLLPACRAHLQLLENKNSVSLTHLPQFSLFPFKVEIPSDLVRSTILSNLETNSF
jgi:hypothetical protein